MPLEKLKGIKGGKLECTFSASRTAVLRDVRQGLAACAPGHLGAITVYIDDAGRYRADLSQFRTVISEGIFTSKKELGKWLKQNWPGIGDRFRSAW